MTETITTTFSDVNLPEPVNRFAMLFARFGTGIALAVFSVVEMVQEINAYRRLRS